MEQANGTPRARPHLKFATSRYAPSTDGNKRFGTPRPARRSQPLDRDALPSSNLNQSSIDTARNIFRASTLSASTGPRFEPSIPRDTPHKVFAPAATPEPKRLFRDSTTKATPRRTLAASTSTELFKMAIPEPPVELTGAELAKKVPEDLDKQLGSVFADQYLDHLCPKDFDQLQRRQFFCVLDLRRLKHAANEIFAKKDWKLNITNFAKEFEKSRSLILLRYGLYEFRNVKPSADILKKWRAAHGLEGEEPEGRDSPGVRRSKSSSKRKADSDLDAGEDRDTRQTAGKRRAVDEETPAADSEFSSKHKRKASQGADAQPTKQQKTATSATKAFLERITSTPTTPAPADVTVSAPPKPLFGAKADTGLARSVLNKNATGGNIFGYLSDASKNSGVDADGESETESEPEDASQQKNGAVDAPAASAPTQSATPAVNPFAPKAPSTSGLGTTASSSSEAPESTPGRSLFDRVTKGTDGQPVRFSPGAEDSQAKATADTASVPPQPATGDTPANKTWTPGTPLKFAPQPTQGSSLFGNASTPASSGLSAAAQPTSSIFGAQKPAKSPEESTQQTIGDANKSGEESDKENASEPASKLLAPSETVKPSNGVAQPAATSLFKPAAAGSESKAEPVDAAKGADGFSSQKPSDAASIFGNKSQPSALFGNATPATQAPTPVAQSSILFGSKPAGDTAAAASDAPKPASLFAAPSATPGQPSTEAPKPASSLFGNAGTASAQAPKTSSLFGPTAQAATSNLFGSSSTSGNALFGSTSSSKPTSSSTSAAPIFSFGSTLGAEATPKGSETPKAQPPKSIFGSPMKQDDGQSPQKRGLGDAMQEDQPSPVKKPFGTTAPPTFFGGPQTSGPGSNNATSFSFGSQQGTPSTSAPSMFGTNALSTGAVNFNFGGAPSPATNFSASFGGTSSTPAPPGGMFNFGAASGPAQQPGSKSFTFGENTSNAAPSPAPMASGNQDASNMFAFNASSNTSRATTPSGRVIKKPNFGASKAKAASARGGFGGTPTPQTPMFGANQGGNAAPTFSISAPSPQPQGQQQNMFGANAGQQPGAMFGGASTSGTSMFRFGTQ